MWKFLLISHFLIAGITSKQVIPDASDCCTGILPVQKGSRQARCLYDNLNFTDNCKGEFVDGAKQGLWKCYYEDGKVQQEGEYVKDEKSGHWKFYHTSGKLALEGNYTADKETGEWIVYDEAGNKIDVIDYGN